MTRTMDFISHPSVLASSSSSLFVNFFERVRETFHFAVSAVIGNIFSAIFTFFFALGWFVSSFFDLSYCFLEQHVLHGLCPIIGHLIVDLILFSEMGLAISWIFGFCLRVLIPITMVNLLVSSFLIFFSFSFWGLLPLENWILKLKLIRIYWRQKWAFWG